MILKHPRKDKNKTQTACKYNKRGKGSELASLKGQPFSGHCVAGCESSGVHKLRIWMVLYSVKLFSIRWIVFCFVEIFLMMGSENLFMSLIIVTSIVQSVSWFQYRARRKVINKYAEAHGFYVKTINTWQCPPLD